MTHLKYQHLNVDILFVGLAEAAIPLQGKGKTQGKFCDKSDEEVCGGPHAQDRLWGERHFSTATAQGQPTSTIPRWAFPLLLRKYYI